jgi:hypothetical protein
LCGAVEDVVEGGAKVRTVVVGGVHGFRVDLPVVGLCTVGLRCAVEASGGVVAPL